MVHVVLDETKILEADGLIVDGGKVIADRRKTRKPRAKMPTPGVVEAIEAGAKGIEELREVAASEGIDPPTDDEPPAF